MRVLFLTLFLLQTAMAEYVIWKSADGGQTWKVILNQPAAFEYVSSIAVDPSNPQVIYAGGTGTVLKSTDGGAHWSGASTGLYQYTVAVSLVVDPGTPSTLYTGTGNGNPMTIGPSGGPPPVYKSLDGGASWAPSSSGIINPYAHPHSSVLALNPQTPATLYAGNEVGLYESTDGAATWHLVIGQITSPDAVTCVRVNPQNPNTIYACTANGLMKSVDGGVTWTATTNPAGAGGISLLAIDPKHGDVLYGSAELLGSYQMQVFTSTDGGAHWMAASLPSPAIEILSLLVDPTVSSRAWAGSSRGLLVSNDSGATWGPPAGSFPSNLIMALGADASGTIYVATGPPLPPIHVDSVVSAASSEVRVAPGEIVSLFGADLASRTASATSFPLPTHLSDTGVGIQNTLAESLAPLFYASAGQINAQIPFEIPIGSPTRITVYSSSGAGAADIPVQLVPAAPAVFTVNGQGTGSGAIIHGLTYGIVNDANPADPGEIISVYCTGLGAVTSSVPTGDVWKTPSQTVIPVQVSIGGTDAQVWYAGVAPGYTGLYQINVQVPAGTPPGAQPLVVTENGIASNTVSVAVR